MSTPGHGLVVASGPDDPRLLDVDDAFREVLIALSGLAAYADRRRTRLLHPASTGARGTLRTVDEPSFPAHAFLRAGREFPVVARWSSARGTDDRGVSPRGLSLRFLDDDGPALDLTFNTGECFFAPTADAFRRLSAGTEQERDRFLADHPHLRATLWDTERVAESFATYELHSQTPRAFVAADGTTWLARFRVRPDGEPVRPGHFDAGDLWWPPTPPDTIPPPDPAAGSPTELRDELDARVAASGVTLLLQVRLHPAGDDPEAAGRALDASRPWPGDGVWHDVAHVRLDTPVPGSEVDALAFDPACAPLDLGIPLSRSPHSTASVGHLRALVYRMSSLSRLGEPWPDELAALLRPVAPSRPALRSVCVIGAGPAGLAAARELERAGHRVVVLEQADHVAGKAASVVVDGHPHDLGAHICTARYRRLAALAAELGVRAEPTPAEQVLTVGGSGRTVTDMAFFADGSIERYERLRAREFPRIGEPGMAHSAAALSAPLSSWLDEHDLRSMYATFGLGYTCAGYGFPDDDLPAVYFVKYCETTGLLSDSAPVAADVPARWTPAGGFGAFWEKVAAGLSDVRLSTTVTSVERGGDGVLVRTDRGDVEADDLVIAVPPDRIVDALDDATATERRIAGRVRYQHYRTTVASVSGLPRDAMYLLGAAADDSSDAGHCIAFQHRYPDSDVYTCYSYTGPGVPDRTEPDLAALGARAFTGHLRRDWTLMPHFTSDDVAAGVLEELEAAQGERHTYRTGGLLGFESVECAIDHAIDLVRRSFPGAGAHGDAPDRVATRTAPEIRDRLRAGIAAELRVPVTSVDPADPLSGYALDSLALAGLMSGLSDFLGRRVPHTLFLQLPTIDAVAGYLAGADTSPAVTRWQATLGRSPDAARTLFCVGGIGASGLYFRPLAAALAPDVTLYPFEVPGRLDGVGEACDGVAEIAAGFVDRVRALVPHGPYRLGGHSYGGVIAYEMGRRLREAGADVAPVTLLDTFVAVAGQPVPDEDEYGALHDQVVIRHMTCLAQGRCDCGVDLDRPLAGQRTAVARALGAVDPDRYDEHIASIIDVQLASIHAYATYGFPASDLTVHLLRTEHGFDPMPAEDFGLRIHLDSPSNGWDRVETGGLRVFPVGGNHFGMFTEPHVREVTDAIRAAAPVPGRPAR